MKVCLAIGERQCEDFLKDSVAVLLDCLNTKNLEDVNVAQQIERIYADNQVDKGTKHAKRVEILSEFFNGHKFLSQLSLTALRAMNSSGITSIDFVEEAPYREAVVDKCKGFGVDVLILSEMLQGKTDFQTLCQDIRIHCENTRIIVIGGQHEKGDDFLKGLVEKGIFDIIYGETLQFADLFKLIFTPNKYADGLQYLKSSQLQPQASAPVTQPAQPLTFSEPVSTNPFAGNESEKREKAFLKKHKKEEAPAPEPVRRDTDLLIPDEPPVTSSGTELIADTGNTLMDGLVAYPYDLKPIVVTNFRTKEGTIYNPDGSTDESGNLPAVIKTIKDKNYEIYVSSLMTDAGTPNRGVMQSRPVTNSGMSYGVKGKSLLFTSSIQGAGCSSLAFNAACMYAAEYKKRVLFIDTCFGESASFARLELPQDIGATIEDVMQDVSQAKNILSKQILLSNARGNDINRFTLLPDTLSYMTWSKELNQAWLQDNLSQFKEVMNQLAYQYDFIIYDSSLLLIHGIHEELLQNADYIIPVVTQDIYTTNKTANQLRSFNHLHIGPKIRLLINRYERTPQLSLSSFSADFFGATAYQMLDDNLGFIRANAQGVPYVLTKTASRKAVKTLRAFILSLG